MVFLIGTAAPKLSGKYPIVDELLVVELEQANGVALRRAGQHVTPPRGAEEASQRRWIMADHPSHQRRVEGEEQVHPASNRQGRHRVECHLPGGRINEGERDRARGNGVADPVDGLVAVTG
jgi:hypothetical protein